MVERLLKEHHPNQSEEKEEEHEKRHQRRQQWQRLNKADHDGT